MAQGLPVRYNDEYGWLIFVATAIPMPAVARAVEHVAHVNTQRMHAMKPGPQKDRVRVALERLRTEGIHQIMTSGDVFKSTEKQHPERRIFA